MLHAGINHAYSVVRTFWGLIRPRSLRWMSFGDGRLGRRKPIDLADELPAHHKTVWFIRIWSLKQLLHSRSTYRRVNMLSMCAAFISGWKADFFLSWTNTHSKQPHIHFTPGKPDTCLHVNHLYRKISINRMFKIQICSR